MKKADFVKAIEDALGDDGSPLTPHGEAIAAGDGTLHGAIDYWQQQAFTMAAGQCIVTNGGLMADDHGHQYCDMERQRDEWKRKAEEAAMDAARYRWLRDDSDLGRTPWITDGLDANGAATVLEMAIADNAIDAAIEKARDA